jgi:hypothetical protein
MFTTRGIQTGWGNYTPPGPPAFSGSYDKFYSQPFTVTATITVTHNLQKYPAVTVVSSAKQIVMGDVEYIDMNNLTVTFSAPFSGTVYCN